MGEMADWINDQLYDTFIDGPPEYFQDPEGAGGPDGVGCKYCLAGPLWWMEVTGGWRLVNDKGQIHSCPEYLASFS